MTSQLKIISVYPCLHKAEQLACRSMANAYLNGVDRLFSVIVGIFQAQLPAAQEKQRHAVWRATYRMVPTTKNINGVPTMVYEPNRAWCENLGDAFADGSMPQNPALCYRLAFINAP